MALAGWVRGRSAAPSREDSAPRPVPAAAGGPSAVEHFAAVSGGARSGPAGFSEGMPGVAVSNMAASGAAASGLAASGLAASGAEPICACPMRRSREPCGGAGPRGPRSAGGRSNPTGMRPPSTPSSTRFRVTRRLGRRRAAGRRTRSRRCAAGGGVDRRRRAGRPRRAAVPGEPGSRGIAGMGGPDVRAGGRRVRRADRVWPAPNTSGFVWARSTVRLRSRGPLPPGPTP